MQWAEILYVVLGAALGTIATILTNRHSDKKRRQQEAERERERQAREQERETRAREQEAERERAQQQAALERKVLELRERSRQVMQNLEDAYDMRRRGLDGWSPLLQDASRFGHDVEYTTLGLHTLAPDTRDHTVEVTGRFFRLVNGLVMQLQHYHGDPWDEGLERTLANAWRLREDLRRTLMTAAGLTSPADPIEVGERSYERRARLRTEERRASGTQDAPTTL